MAKGSWSWTVATDRALVRGFLSGLTETHRSAGGDDGSMTGDHLLDSWSGLRHELDELLRDFGSDPSEALLPGVIEAAQWFAGVAGPLFELVEAAVRLAEAQYGPGRGPQKRAFAVAALTRSARHFGQRHGFPALANNPALQVSATFLVVGLVDVINLRNVWGGSSTKPSFLLVVKLWFIRWISRLIQRIAALLLRLERSRLTPVQLAEIDSAFIAPQERLERALLGDGEHTLAELGAQKRRFARVGRRIFLIADLVIDDVEDLTHLSGTEKLALARDTIMRILIDRLGLAIDRSSWMGTVVGSVLEGLINGLVDVLNRSGELRPHAAREAQPSDGSPVREDRAGEGRAP